MTDALIIRPYTPADEAACLDVFDGNTPEFFAPAEHVEFAAYLRHPGETILVAEAPGAGVVAVGGYYVRSVAGGPAGHHEGDREGALAWGMVARAWHRRGVGGMLLRARLLALGRAGARAVSVRTSQHSRGFFERAGFAAVREVQDGFAPGIDLVELRRLLDDAADSPTVA